MTHADKRECKYDPEQKEWVIKRLGPQETGLPLANDSICRRKSNRISEAIEATTKEEKQ